MWRVLAVLAFSCLPLAGCASFAEAMAQEAAKPVVTCAGNCFGFRARDDFKKCAYRGL